MKKKIVLCIIFLVITTVFFCGCSEDASKNTESKTIPVEITNDCSDSIDVQLEFEMYDFNAESNNFSTVYESYENISIQPGETWTYTFKAPESIESQYLSVFLFPVRCGENSTSYSYSSTWFRRRADIYRVYETEDGIDIEWLGKP